MFCLVGDRLLRGVSVLRQSIMSKDSSLFSSNSGSYGACFLAIAAWHFEIEAKVVYLWIM